MSELSRRSVLAAAIAAPLASSLAAADVGFMGGEVIEYSDSDGVLSATNVPPGYDWALVGSIVAAGKVVYPGRWYTRSEWERCRSHDERLILRDHQRLGYRDAQGRWLTETTRHTHNI